MWKRFITYLRCVQCGGELELKTIEERSHAVTPDEAARAEKMGLSPAEISAFVEAGLLLCHECSLWYPVFHGLPVMLPYATTIHRAFHGRYASLVRDIRARYTIPQGRPMIGEKQVLKSFTAEWKDYSFDDVLWIWTYGEREAAFLKEIGIDALPPGPSNFLELGCGLGVVSSFAAKHLGGDCVGVDLSLAAARAARHFRDNPFLHFVQASLWHLPFEKERFDVVYSHGVLHHTFSTKKAFRSIAAFCRPGGVCYIWVYGRKSIEDNLARRMAYLAEILLRPVLSRLPFPWPDIVLSPVALAYMGVNLVQRKMGQKRQAYDFSRALHAARDRFTPLFAHRASLGEVRSWFREAGFDEIKEVSLSELPPAVRGTFRINIGIRGRKMLPSR